MRWYVLGQLKRWHGQIDGVMQCVLWGIALAFFCNAPPLVGLALALLALLAAVDLAINAAVALGPVLKAARLPASCHRPATVTTGVLSLSLLFFCVAVPANTLTGTLLLGNLFAIVAAAFAWWSSGKAVAERRQRDLEAARFMAKARAEGARREAEERARPTREQVVAARREEYRRKLAEIDQDPALDEAEKYAARELLKQKYLKQWEESL